MTTIDEFFSDQQRQRLKQLVIAAIPHDHGDSELTIILSRLSGTDTVLIARRAYASHQADLIVGLESDVYENVMTHELTFDYDPKTCVCVGSTTGTLQDFIQWHEKQLATKGDANE